MKKRTPLSLLFNKTFCRFCVIGGCAFTIDSSIVFILSNIFSFHPLTSRIFSFLIVVTFSWRMNRTFTFKVTHKKNLIKEWKQYIKINSFGVIINLAFYTILIYSVKLFFLYPVIPITISTTVSMFFNYYFTKNYAFKKIL